MSLVEPLAVLGPLMFCGMVGKEAKLKQIVFEPYQINQLLLGLGDGESIINRTARNKMRINNIDIWSLKQNKKKTHRGYASPGGGTTNLE